MSYLCAEHYRISQDLKTPAGRLVMWGGGHAVGVWGEKKKKRNNYFFFCLHPPFFAIFSPHKLPAGIFLKYLDSTKCWRTSHRLRTTGSIQDTSTHRYLILTQRYCFYSVCTLQYSHLGDEQSLLLLLLCSGVKGMQKFHEQSSDVAS